VSTNKLTLIFLTDIIAHPGCTCRLLFILSQMSTGSDLSNSLDLYCQSKSTFPHHFFKSSTLSVATLTDEDLLTIARKCPYCKLIVCNRFQWCDCACVTAVNRLCSNTLSQSQLFDIKQQARAEYNLPPQSVITALTIRRDSEATKPSSLNSTPSLLTPHPSLFNTPTQFISSARSSPMSALDTLLSCAECPPISSEAESDGWEEEEEKEFRPEKRKRKRSDTNQIKSSSLLSADEIREYLLTHVSELPDAMKVSDLELKLGENIGKLLRPSSSIQISNRQYCHLIDGLLETPYEFLSGTRGINEVRKPAMIVRKGSDFSTSLN